ncbi:hypothetical protein SERLADRAFT_456471 [Serpula lacrymans var. lacrymans S7.9]|uniref:DUF7330 domain-containing protein n=1 Tax=Serpula lacrymans var. lacrymans (strain S7.9) TaxID=578457 RepID=F8NGP1_SERL9|nr:uncharacterized protein SERLADRAFT_456471 [Serpula lacrymans var. lacrymans S7.9]EGO29123.1 hypothetical protein SERLADRAFT_456471 [Serpula lacrymans var. lacrymans S7.9]
MTLRASAQSPLNPGQLSSNRKNLSFATQNGSISAEIWLLGPRANSNTQPKQATLSLESLNGSIRTWIDNVNGRVPVQVDARTQNGNITLHIPRSFHGYIFASAPNGDFSLSTAINAHATVLGHSHREQRYFVGDMSSVDEERWTSDELNVHSNNGRIKIGYVDENNFVNNASPRSNTYTYSTTTGGNSGGTPLRRNTFGGRGFFSNSTNTVFSGQYNVVVGNQVNINNHSINSSNHTTYDRSNANTRNNVRGTRTSTYSTPGSFNARFPNVNVNVSSDDVNEAQDVNVSLPGFSYFSRFFGLG